MQIKMRHNILMITAAMALSNMAVAAQSVELSSETGDSLMLHKLHSDQLWATFQITDQILASFAMQELIVVQVDKNKPVKLQQSKKVCGSPAPKEKQELTYSFDPEQLTAGEWAFSEVQPVRKDVLKVFKWDSEVYDYLPSDRRAEYVDFPMAPIAVDSPNLWQQFEQGKEVVFRYVTETGEARQAKFSLADLRPDMIVLKK